MINLYPFQQTAVADTVAAWNVGHNPLLVLPTGGGKTHTALAALAAALKPGQRVVWSAHRSELIDQAAERMVHHDLPRPGFVQASRNEPDAQFVLATTQTLIKRMPSVLAGGPVHYYVRDEAHRVLSDTDLGIIRYLSMFHARVETRHLGLTATPNRTDGAALSYVYDTAVSNLSTRYLIENGYLVPPTVIDVQLESLSLYHIPLANGDFRAKLVGELLDNQPTCELVFNQWLNADSSRPTLGFTSSVAQAKHLAEYFQSRGVRAAWMSGKTTRSEEAGWDEGGMLTAFKKGAIQVLFNCYKLIEGVDLPSCSCILWVRPTLSPLVLQQGVGRGLRTHPDKDDCLVIMFNPLFNRLASVEDIMDSPENPLGSWAGVEKVTQAQKVDRIIQALDIVYGGGR